MGNASREVIINLVRINFVESVNVKSARRYRIAQVSIVIPKPKFDVDKLVGTYLHAVCRQANEANRWYRTFGLIVFFFARIQQGAQAQKGQNKTAFEEAMQGKDILRFFFVALHNKI